MPAGPWAPVSPVSPLSPFSPLGPASPTEAGNLPSEPNGTSLPGVGVRDALMPFTDPAFLANAARFAKDTPLAACPTVVEPSSAAVSAAMERTTGSRQFQVLVLCIVLLPSVSV